MSVFSAKKPVGKLVYAFEALALLALVLLEYISGYKGGLMKHLYFRKMEYMFSWYTPDWIVIHAFGVLVLLVCTIVWLRCGERSGYASRCLCRTLMYGMTLLFSFYVPMIKALIVYPYLLMVLEVLFVFEAVKIALNKFAVAT